MKLKKSLTNQKDANKRNKRKYIKDGNGRFFFTSESSEKQSHNKLKVPFYNVAIH